MIVLCANCHGRKGSGSGRIDRKSLRQYKANLAIVNSRYGDLERRVLDYYVDLRKQLTAAYPPEIVVNWLRSIVTLLPSTMRLLMTYLVRDGYIGLDFEDPSPFNIVVFPEDLVPSKPGADPMSGHKSMTEQFSSKTDVYRLTPEGVEFIAAWSNAQPIDGLAESGSTD
jgi:hypothetical protein